MKKNKIQKSTGIALFVVFILISFSLAAYTIGGVVWSEKDTNGFARVRYRELRNTGWSSETEYGNMNFMIDTERPVEQYTPSLAYDFYGRPVVSWWEGYDVSNQLNFDDVKTAVWMEDHWQIYVMDSSDIGNCHYGWDYAPRLATAPNGHVGMVWNEARVSNGKWKIRYREWNGRSWSRERDFYDGKGHYKLEDWGQHSYAPSIAFDMYSHPIIAFNYYSTSGQNYAIWWNGKWWAYEQLNIHSTVSNDVSYSPRVFTARNGHVGAIWSEYDGNNYRTRFREWNGEAWSERYDYGAYTQFYATTEDGGNNQYHPWLAYDGDSKPITFYRNHGTNNMVAHMWDNYAWLIESPLGYTGKAADNDYRFGHIQAITAPNGKVGAVWSELNSGNSKYMARFREWDSSLWTNDMAYGGLNFRIVSEDRHQYSPRLMYDMFSRPIVVYFNENSGTYYKLYGAWWDGSSWDLTELQSDTTGDLAIATDSFKMDPYTATPFSNVHVKLIDDDNKEVWRRQVQVLEEGLASWNTTTSCKRHSTKNGIIFCYINPEPNYTVQTDSSKSTIAYNVKMPAKLQMRQYSANVNLENITVIARNENNKPLKHQKVVINETHSDKMAFTETNDAGRAIMGLDSARNYDVSFNNKIVKNVRLPYTIVFDEETPEMVTVEPTLLSMYGRAQYKNKTMIRLGSFSVTIKDQYDNIVWGPYEFNNSLRFGEFALPLGGQNQLQLIPQLSYKAEFTLCDLSGFDPANGLCGGTSTHYEVFTTEIKT